MQAFPLPVMTYELYPPLRRVMMAVPAVAECVKAHDAALYALRATDDTDPEEIAASAEQCAEIAETHCRAAGDYLVACEELKARVARIAEDSAMAAAAVPDEHEQTTATAWRHALEHVQKQLLRAKATHKRAASCYRRGQRALTEELARRADQC